MNQLFSDSREVLENPVPVQVPVVAPVHATIRVHDDRLLAVHQTAGVNGSVASASTAAQPTPGGRVSDDTL